MKNITRNYEISQGKLKYKLSTKVNQRKLILKCKKINSEKSSVYYGEFFPAELIKLSPLFSSISNIYDTQDIFEKIIIEQKIIVEAYINYINLKIFIKKEDDIEENFTIKLNLINKDEIPKQSLSDIFNIKNRRIQYSPPNINKNNFIQLPKRNIDNIDITSNNIRNSLNNDNLLSNKLKKIKISKIILSLKSQPINNKINFNNNNLLSQSLSYGNIIQSEKRNYLMNNNNKELENTKNIINNGELKNLKNENNKLNNEIIQLKTQIELLTEENHNLNLIIDEIKKNQIENNNISKEIILLKTENERYINENNILKNKLNDFEEYKRIKEKEINNLNAFIDKLKIQIKEYQYIIKMNKEKETLIIHDSHVEIVKGDIIRKAEELEFLTRKMCKKHKKIILNLIYKASTDSDKAEIFHKKCDSSKSTLVLIKSKNEKRFGGFTSCDWKGNCINKKDNNAFIFSLDKMKIYDVIPGEDAIGCYPNYGPIFLGCQIRVYDQFFRKGGTTFEKMNNYYTQEDYELSGGLEKFNINEIEVYSVKFE